MAADVPIPQIRVLVADDEQNIREALSALIDGEEGFELVGAAPDVATATALAEREKPDVALVDVKMPEGGGPVATRAINEVSPETRVIALSAYDDRATVLDMLRAGASGYLVKGTSSSEILEAVRRAVRGQASLSLDMTTDVVEELVRDRTERTAQKDELRRSEEKLARLIESAPDGVVIVDGEGRIKLVNEQAEKLFRHRREDLLGQPVEMLLPERFRARHVGHRANYLADPVTRPMGAGLELAGLREDGSEFPIDISLSTIESDEGQLVTAFVRDITQRTGVEEARREVETRFAAMIESAPDGVVTVSSDGRIVLVNTQIEALFGYARDEVLGEPVDMLLPQRFRDRHIVHRAGYLEDPVMRRMGDLTGLRKNGTEFSIDISLSTVMTEQGRLAIAFVRDSTDRRASEELQRTFSERRAVLAHLVSAGEDERARIASDIHDDSIQAMTAAGMRLQIARRSIDDPDQLELLDDLEQTIQLSISRLRHLLFELHPPALDHEGLAPALRMYIDSAEGESGIPHRLEDRLRSEPDAETRVILYRVVQEALTNARKHAQPSVVIVSLDQRDRGYMVHVTDDGIGFAPETLKAVPGHLGLAAMRERIELADGTVRIESAVGEGTTIEIWLPARAVSEPESDATIQSADETG
jgi:PAS domain S-box-containing protein